MNDPTLQNREKTRIIQELVPGKQITLAHIIANPDEILYKKLGLDPAAVAQTVSEGRGDTLLNHLPPQEAAKLRPLLANPDAAAQIIASPQAQALLKKWFGSGTTP